MQRHRINWHMEETYEDKDGQWVRFEDAQSELAALRGELITQRNHFREQLRDAKQADQLQIKLAAAEQRNADLLLLLEHAYGAIDENDGWKGLCARILAVIQPTESGASE